VAAAVAEVEAVEAVEAGAEKAVARSQSHAILLL